ncbi:GntR family transcriptional regulator [Streptomyces sp. DSM 44915]|uniref:GntR family transcriptional regulator n=1 Tax=Streptomyces chisholmiae TaxID=3075540 RepID=A0ABU2JKR2_9ACTN|nr:GntR family transcriptional regulator [Streptomyces sp. DSM 44915]MDT0265574.1 GntR family transcriptional regulator [Streptomyces sp. DSM 44915]
MLRVVQYQRIAHDLRQQITERQLSPGDRLPSEHQLSTRYGVGVPTVRQAMALLEMEGLVDKQHGKGTFVRAPRPRTQYRDDRHTWADWQPTPEHLTQHTTHRTTADHQLSALLAVPVATVLTEHRYTTRVLDHAPHILVRAYVHPDIEADLIAGTAPSPWGDDLHQALVAAGVELAEVTERVTARPPTAEEAQAMNLSGGIALLEITRTTTDTTGRVAAAAVLRFAGDRAEAIYSRAVPPPN